MAKEHDKKGIITIQKVLPNDHKTDTQHEDITVLIKTQWALHIPLRT